MKKHQPVLDQLYKVLDSYKPQPKAYYDHLGEIMTPKYCPTDEVRFEKDEVVKTGYFLSSGFAFNYYYNDQGERQVVRIYQPGEIIKGKSFTDQQPSAEYLMACGGAYLLMIDYQDMQEIYQLFPGVTELSMLILAGREQKELEHKQMLRMAAPGRVAAFYRTFPGLSEPGKIMIDADIASYLLISDRTLRSCRSH